MGLFDYVFCDYPLPVSTKPNEEFQTKDTDRQCMDSYRITADGRLLQLSSGLRLYKGPPRSSHETGLERNTFDEPVEVPFHGDINFYGESGDFIARFTEGRVSRIWEVKHDEVDQEGGGDGFGE